MTEGFFSALQKKNKSKGSASGRNIFFSFRSFGSSGAIRKSPTSGKKGVGRAGGIEQGIKSNYGLFLRGLEDGGVHLFHPV